MPGVLIPLLLGVALAAVADDDAAGDGDAAVAGEVDGVGGAGAGAIPDGEERVGAADHRQVAQNAGLAAVGVPVGGYGLDGPAGSVQTR